MKVLAAAVLLLSIGKSVNAHSEKEQRTGNLRAQHKGTRTNGKFRGDHPVPERPRAKTEAAESTERQYIPLLPYLLYRHGIFI